MGTKLLSKREIKDKHEETLKHEEATNAIVE